MTLEMFPEVEDGTAGDSNQRFTITRAKLWCMERAQVDRIDLDVAACAESHLAPAWYGWKDGQLINGLELPWFGVCWLNPPWDDLEPWIKRATDWMNAIAAPAAIIALLPQGRCHRPWWQKYVEPFRDRAGTSLRSFYPPERFPYGHKGNPEAIGVGEPNFGSVCLVWNR